MHYPSLVINLRRGVDDSLAKRWTNDDCGAALDRAAKIIQGELKLLQNRRSFSLVANQREYSIDSTCLQPYLMEYQDVDTFTEIEGKGLDGFRDLYRSHIANARPTLYTILEEEGKYILAPQPSTAAAATTLSADITAGATSMTLTDSTSFGTEGRCLIGSEVIGWTGNATSTGVLSGLQRGLEGTTAATHSATDAVTERDIHVWQVRRYADREMRTYYTAGTINITNASAAVVGTSTVWTTGIAVGDYLGVTTNVTEIDPVKWYKVTVVTDNTHLTLDSTYAEASNATANYIVGSPNPFPGYVDPALISLARSFMLEKDRELDLSARQYGQYKAIIAEIRKSHTKGDDKLIAGSRPSMRGGRLRLRMLDRTI